MTTMNHFASCHLRRAAVAVAALVWGLSVFSSLAQELEPRRWSHLPIDANFAGLGYAYTKGDIGFDPVLLIDDAVLQLHTGALKYVRTFKLFDKLARIDLLQGYQDARWSGLLNGVPTTTARSGLSDTLLRFSMNLVGSPPLKGEEFAEYRASVGEHETIVGAGVVLGLPTGNYLEDRLLNLGSNRFTIRPQFGIMHNWGKWTAELTGAAWIYSDNDDFFGGNQLEVDPLYTVQGHLVHTFRPGLWISTGLAYGKGAQSTLNGILKDDKKGNLGWGISAGYPLNPKLGVKIGYIGFRTQEKVGSDLDNIFVAVSVLW